jgi:DNA-binding LytR/AlgR family response regulator
MGRTSKRVSTSTKSDDPSIQGGWKELSSRKQKGTSKGVNKQRTDSYDVHNLYRNKQNESTGFQHVKTHSNQTRIGLSRHRGEIDLFELDQILRIESHNTYVTFHFVPDSKIQEITIKESIGKLEQLLPSDQFFRVHNENIVNLLLVKKFNIKDEYVVMSNDETVTVSRRNKQSLLAALSLYP